MKRAANSGLALTVGLTLLFAPSDAAAVNFKKAYCKKQDYLGNPSNKYPHLHCGPSFFTLSRGADHVNLNSHGNCKKANELLADPPWNAKNSNDPGAITAAIMAFVADGCP